MEFNEILYLLRRAKNLSQKNLGMLLGLSVSTVCDWEKKRSEPNINQLSLLSDVFGVSVDFLIGRSAES